ncbi:hypothetical protein DFH05DRAFT_757881 [Lentinula detonsa]|uniref:Uncharacterized protein n=1 Tax=Lentinula detonsa TaxID=2804962 RepID=A0A9W8NQI0_9AGAR|nr:hypothetical protein DFH05DRAFT_757881 [Lentinula detonsa]KAJ3981046.1 hypothetical protein F5890DRAFT_594972 [Lentinula detonsa]
MLCPSPFLILSCGFCTTPSPSALFLFFVETLLSHPRCFPSIFVHTLPPFLSILPWIAVCFSAVAALTHLHLLVHRMPGLGTHLLRLVHSILCCSSFVHAQSGPSESSCSTLSPIFCMDVQLSISFHYAIYIHTLSSSFSLQTILIRIICCRVPVQQFLLTHHT